MQPYPDPQAYRQPGLDRLYLCPGCSTAQRAPAQGGAVTCPQCRAPFALPDRSAMLGNPGQVPMPPDDPGRIAYLRTQDGRPRVPGPNLLSVLGGPSVQPGREQEALVIWQSLRARSAQGDVAASEDLTNLTLLLANSPLTDQQPQLLEALSESTYDAAVLPRHKQEQLGRLARSCIARGDRAGAQRYLSWMVPNAPELEADSEFRVSQAVAATMDRDPQKVLALLGPQKDAIPIVDSMDAMASVFRANAFESMGNVAAAQAVLRELPAPEILAHVRRRFQHMAICPQSAAVYASAQNQAAAQRAAASAGGIGLIIGGILAVVGLCEVGVGVATSLAFGADLLTGGTNLGIGAALLVAGVVVVVRSRAKGKHAAWLRVNGIPLTARIVNAQPTGTRINYVPVYQFVLQVAGPHGPYTASFTKLVPEHQVAMLMGQEVRVRANPNKLEEVILEE